MERERLSALRWQRIEHLAGKTMQCTARVDDVFHRNGVRQQRFNQLQRYVAGCVLATLRSPVLPQQIPRDAIHQRCVAGVHRARRWRALLDEALAAIREYLQYQHWGRDDFRAMVEAKPDASRAPDPRIDPPSSGSEPGTVSWASPAAARERWEQARQDFIVLHQAVTERLGQLEDLRVALGSLPALRKSEALARIRLQDSKIASFAASQSWEETKECTRIASQAAETAKARLDQHERERPAWFVLKRMFRAEIATQWEGKRAPLRQTHTDAQISYRQAAVDEARALQMSDQSSKVESEANQLHSAARAALDEALSCCDAIRVGDGACVLDGEFHQLPHSNKNLSVPWLDQSLQAQRSQLFEAAMAVHRAFIDVAALPLLRNLQGLVGGNFKLGIDRKHMAAELWSSLFLVVPVISTTFASVERMLNQLPDESLGWLLVDEAGQATPQSVVGALLRTQRALIVGDPLQVEPVVPLPPVLTRAVMLEFNVDPDRFAAPSASVQTLADSGSEHCARFETTSGSRAVGAPLLVHRRCASPMFEISNRVAYNNLMVQAKTPAPSLIRDVLGPSQWVDVRGASREKYSPQEGEEVLSLLRKLRENHVDPDLYIVTPFVVVQDELRELVKGSGLLNGWVEGPSEWIYERIGTVHTVQGREAQAVIFVLGAPQAAQQGARQWAGSAPNLLNVAVTRAKEALYVVGNRSLWAGAGHFAALDQMIEATSSRYLNG